VFADSFQLTGVGYPKYYSVLFQFLKAAGNAVRADSYSSPSLRGRFSVNLGEGGQRLFYENVDTILSDIRCVLSILYVPYSIRLPLNEAQIEKALSTFEERVTNVVDPIRAENAERIGSQLTAMLNPFLADRSVNRKIQEPMNVCLSLSTYKSRGEHGNGLVPITLTFADNRNVAWNSIFTYSEPVGRVNVIGERAGKTRVITSYDGQINATDLFDRCRSILNLLPGDFSGNQTEGHKRVQKMTATPLRPGFKIVSADLSSFTDLCIFDGVRPFLGAINCSDFEHIYRSPIKMPDNRVIRPTKLLMGLRGTFEVCSLLHNSILLYMASQQKYHKEYAMCGDDVCFMSTEHTEYEDSGFYSHYEDLASRMGLEMNFSKTVESRDTAVFCGKVFFLGHDVSPFCLPLKTLETVTTFNELVLAVGGFIARLREGPVRPNLVKGTFAVLKRLLGPRLTGLPLPTNLPLRLGGLGYSREKSLLSQVEDPVINSNFIYVPRVDDDDNLLYTRRDFRIPVVPLKSTNPPFPFLYGYGLGVIRRFRKPRRTLPQFRSPEFKDPLAILEYFYEIGNFSVS
jgi:hypothetical protein